MVHHPIRVLGPREFKLAQADGQPVVWTVSHAREDWQRDLSPFFLGPVPLYDGRVSRCMENAWQYAKVYAGHVGADNEPTAAYWEWASSGWSRPAVRYPMGKGAKPQYLLWAGQKLGYVDARACVYWPLYRDAVRATAGFSRLQELHLQGPLNLFDFDGYDHERLGLGLRQAALNTSRPMGHAFVLKAMLLYGSAIDVAGLDSDLAQERMRYEATPGKQPELF